MVCCVLRPMVGPEEVGMVERARGVERPPPQVGNGSPRTGRGGMERPEPTGCVG